MRSQASIENTRRLSREAKRRRTGRCACGATTRYNGHRGVAVSERCLRCAAIESGAARRGVGPVKDAIVAGLRERGEMRFTEIVQAHGLTKGHAARQLNALVGYGLIVRVRRGVYALPEGAI